ncbi:N-acetylglucosamine-6-phosphate deacetylase [Breznakia sp. PF5-3]|uniref:N-acetylglucosamine-6-phosphate deacetylase n=1 Tax=unclassified Breznakia TaxID=2623764 RepID=UPI002405939C|nr:MULTISPECIES: N-acetylglucosamine-6-phosphate deacetylase [unclassified Breznakia]MDL2276812.1 N-acetylglucosamine-6-phosphate deacetylase [Breznakia sp. OttesenSCG-928-G09]MDF9824056.1 N-acetylglucosamine-6-phosphate deacetylase [Breznakia sp. PM6-1]MDF9834878.1 N-acetylglucosamine-6-phosphate deacetylase [Breznakia sp. PF5-3]MDF9837100.1 N-acetylglucosamine-6-phosphate deacetylase [Breznakia sp. PFB2-8]MDF9859025.1 N-acetylglucosamine-6-phosphate deacetylase [Breznakia sp. PH5-24]
MKTLLYNGIVVVDGHTSLEQGGVLIEGDKIIEVLAANDPKFQIYQQDHDVVFEDVKGNYIMPGLIDIHMHGGVGSDFIDATKDDIHKIAHNLVEDGCTGFLASLTAVSQEEIVETLKMYATIEDDGNGAHFLGVHGEGPYLSREYKAVMIEEHLRAPSIKELDEMISASDNRIRQMTIAPELDGMMEFIEYGAKHNIAMMIGHSAADSKTTTAAIKHGAVGFTHLYNAMSQHLHRTPGVVTSAFINKDAYVELIADGFHVDPEVVLMTYLNKGAEKIVLITDAMLGKGMPDGEFYFSGKNCIKDGYSVTVIETGRRAGSAVGLDYVIRTMAEITGCTVNEIVQMACINPSKVIKIDTLKGTLEVGKDADICIMDKNYQNQQTYVSGKCVYKR